MEALSRAFDPVLNTLAAWLQEHEGAIPLLKGSGLNGVLTQAEALDWANNLLQVGLVVVVIIAILTKVAYDRLKAPFQERVAQEVDNAEDAVEVIIQWCGGCGFQQAYEATEKLLLEQYPRKVRIVSRRDADVSGNFEITVNGYLAHSMRTKRHGFVHNNPSREKAVFAAIDVALEELHEKES
mmetsp:Transcript_22065/g.43404  ORF Transcript_22065/g.43404 Transcript_22065/m.43404 type:complete len:183 (+) Transcript_22065:130-678(+)